MKTILMLLTAVSFNAFATDFLGTYSIRENDGSITEVAKISSRNQKIYIKFKSECTATLSKTTKGYEGSCTSGSGYRQILWQARLKMNGQVPTLEFRGLEHGDAENGFLEFSKAYLLF